MLAPAAIASLATSALNVSIEMHAVTPAALAALMTGMTLWSSSSTGTTSAFGLVDCPPMSMMSAPSSHIVLIRATAASVDELKTP
eukprot:CAMPEP_0206218908 /NCGR_PEP_ID=MMETSP0047_2-20121206/4042_1 /ASSEMBLY_ACC=CAM_ASM_000192 /TAXON_ID=195065 /ORGANISM="Chroomonas mesostigmatica_cf, Strain CCMP1168" /LENGTH=84 /DNA_ID=CAMNT_0053641427 /DNA_START=319 /DNA_END=569 /DNA_ORIENTATION=-